MISRYRAMRCRIFRPRPQKRSRSLFHAFPAVVAVHIIISADYRSHARRRIELCDFVLDFANVFYRAVRRNVATVGYAVDINALYVLALCKIDEREKVVDRAVHAAVRGEPHEVKRRVVLFNVFDRAQKHGVGENSPSSMALSILVMS